MRYMIKSLFGGAAMLGLACQAAALNIGGVEWNPDDPNDFLARSDNIVQNFSTNAEGRVVLSGYGQVTRVNFDTSFCSGCELTFEYGGYTGPVGFSAGDFGSFDFTDGFVNVFVDGSPDFDVNNGATANDGDLWLSLVSNGALSVDADQSGATGKGLLDVNGGIAEVHFDTNTLANGADVGFQNSFTVGSGFTLGSGNIESDTVNVPEPGTLGLLGLGLIGMVAARKRLQAS